MKDKKVREPIATWWKISRYGVKIEPLQIVAFTGSFVTYVVKEWSMNGDRMVERRERRDDVFPTFAEAKAEFVRWVELEVESEKNQLHRARTKLGMVKSLREMTASEL